MIFILIPFIYFLTLFQASFLGFFAFQGYVFNLVLIAVLLFNLLESQRKISGLILAVSAGFFLDIFSSGLFSVNFFGFWVLIFITFSLFIKYIFKKHVQLPFFCR